jgi:hypothetical protein
LVLEAMAVLLAAAAQPEAQVIILFFLLLLPQVAVVVAAQVKLVQTEALEAVVDIFKTEALVIIHLHRHRKVITVVTVLQTVFMVEAVALALLAQTELLVKQARVALELHLQ